MIEMHYLFPTALWKTNVPLTEKEKSDLINYHNEIRETTQGKNYSNNSWQSQDKFSEHESFIPLKKLLQDNITPIQEEIFKRYSIELANMWFNSQEMGMWNKLHSHGVFGLSGVYYLKVPEGSGKIVFERNLLEKNIIDNVWGLCDSSFEPSVTTFEVQPREGDLLIFPSWLGHWVDRSSSFDTRISVAFNLVLRD
jgi:uncharacterized protein (TIGR02466 family)